MNEEYSYIIKHVVGPPYDIHAQSIFFFYYLRYEMSDIVFTFTNQLIIFLSFQLFNRGHGNLAAATYGTYSFNFKPFCYEACVSFWLKKLFLCKTKTTQ